MELKEIAKGWIDFVYAPEENKPVIEKRLAICNDCEYKVQLSKTAINIITMVHEKASIYKCGKCNCPLAGKSANMESKCPLGKW